MGQTYARPGYYGQGYYGQQPPIIIYNNSPPPQYNYSQDSQSDVTVYNGGIKKNLKELNLKELKIISSNMNIEHNNVKKKDLYKLVYNSIKENNI